MSEKFLMPCQFESVMKEMKIPHNQNNDEALRSFVWVLYIEVVMFRWDLILEV